MTNTYKVTFLNAYGETCTAIESAISKEAIIADYANFLPEGEIISIELY